MRAFRRREGEVRDEPARGVPRSLALAERWSCPCCREVARLSQMGRLVTGFGMPVTSLASPLACASPYALSPLAGVFPESEIPTRFPRCDGAAPSGPRVVQLLRRSQAAIRRDGSAAGLGDRLTCPTSQVPVLLAN